MRKLLLIILIVMCSTMVLSAETCLREQSPADIPCIVVSSWDYPDVCNSYSVSIYNLTGDLIQIRTLGDFGGYCNFTFNITDSGAYYYNISSGDTGSVLVKERDKMIIGIAILLPFLLGIVFLVGSIALNEEHTPLKIFLFLLTPITFFTSFHMALTSVVKFYNFPELQLIIGTSTYWFTIIFGVILAYIFIYIFIKSIHLAAQKKKERLNY